MINVSEKYIAGLIDSDGSVGFTQLKTGWKPTMVLSISQKTCHADVLKRIQEQEGGHIRSRFIGKDWYSEYNLNGKSAVKLLFRLSKHLVIKRDYVEWCLQVEPFKIIGTTTEFNKLRKEKRHTKCLQIKNFPSRKWLAGYFDGDGCCQVTTISNTGYPLIRFSISAHENDIVGLELIQKAFGGSLNKMNKNGQVYEWKINCGRNKRELLFKFVEYFYQETIIKKNQLSSIVTELRKDSPNGHQLKLDLQKMKRPLAETN